MNNLYEAYINGAPEARALFARAPETLFTDAPPPGVWVPGLADAINQYQTALGHAKPALTGEEHVVATGQQPGLFTGPLYTIYKAVTAIQLARRLAQGNTACVPVFWVASDDHDFEEVRAAHVLSRDHSIRTVAFHPEHEELDIRALPLYRIPVTASLHAAVDELHRVCRGSEQSAEIRDFLHDSLDQAHSLSEWFVIIMARLFSRTELLLFVPHIHASRLGAMPVLRQAMEMPLRDVAILNAQGDVLEKLGIGRPIHRADHECNFFLEAGGRRRKVIFHEGRYRIPTEKLSCSTTEMVALLEMSPERFSPNVALRPIVQQRLFPVSAYVAGPGEITYWGQLRPLFDYFDTPMPTVYPRARATITTLKTNKLLHALDLTVADIMENRDIRARALRAMPPHPALQALQRERAHYESALETLIIRLGISADDPGPAHRATARFQRNAVKSLDALERALLHADVEQRGIVESRLERLRNHITPLGKPQERALSLCSFLFEHGWSVIDRFLDDLNPERTDVQEVEL